MSNPRCLDDYLTEKCASCDHWNNDKDVVGCCAPFPINQCEAFTKAEKYIYEKISQGYHNLNFNNICKIDGCRCHRLNSDQGCESCETVLCYCEL